MNMKKKMVRQSKKPMVAPTSLRIALLLVVVVVLLSQMDGLQVDGEVFLFPGAIPDVRDCDVDAVGIVPHDFRVVGALSHPAHIALPNGLASRPAVGACGKGKKDLMDAILTLLSSIHTIVTGIWIDLLLEFGEIFEIGNFLFEDAHWIPPT